LGSRAKKSAEEAVLSALKALGECNFNTLKRLTGLSYYKLSKVIEELVLEGIVVEKRVGRLRIIRLSGSLRA